MKSPIGSPTSTMRPRTSSSGSSAAFCSSASSTNSIFIAFPLLNRRLHHRAVAINLNFAAAGRYKQAVRRFEPHFVLAADNLAAALRHNKRRKRIARHINFDFAVHNIFLRRKVRAGSQRALCASGNLLRLALLVGRVARGQLGNVNGFINMQFTQLAVRTAAAVVVHAVCRVGILLNFTNENPAPIAWIVPD